MIRHMQKRFWKINTFFIVLDPLHRVNNRANIFHLRFKGNFSSTRIKRNLHFFEAMR